MVHHMGNGGTSGTHVRIGANGKASGARTPVYSRCMSLVPTFVGTGLRTTVWSQGTGGASGSAVSRPERRRFSAGCGRGGVP